MVIQVRPSMYGHGFVAKVMAGRGLRAVFISSVVEAEYKQVAIDEAVAWVAREGYGGYEVIAATNALRPVPQMWFQACNFDGQWRVLVINDQKAKRLFVTPFFSSRDAAWRSAQSWYDVRHTGIIQELPDFEGDPRVLVALATRRHGSNRQGLIRDEITGCVLATCLGANDESVGLEMMQWARARGRLPRLVPSVVRVDPVVFLSGLPTISLPGDRGTGDHFR